MGAPSPDGVTRVTGRRSSTNPGLPTVRRLAVGRSEKAGNRTVCEHFIDRLGNQRSDRQDRQFVDSTLARNRQGVGDNNFCDPRILEALSGWVAQDAVGGGNDDFRRTLIKQGVRGLRDRSPGVDHVVDQHTDAVLDITDDLKNLDLIRDVGIATLVNDCQWGVENVGPTFGDAHPTGIR